MHSLILALHEKELGAGPNLFISTETWGFPVGKLGNTRLPVMVYISV